MIIKMQNKKRFLYKVIDKITSKKGIRYIVPSTIQLKIKYYLRLNKKLSIKSPQTFGEKLQWLKIYDRNPLYTQLVDKHQVREYVQKIIGEEYLIPLLGVYNKVEEIDFTQLPNQFVLKCTHDSGGVVICNDKTQFDKHIAEKKLKKHLKTNYYWSKREWPYKHIKPKIICEQYMQHNNRKNQINLIDYKFYCFNGEPHFCQIINGRGYSESIDFFDMNWNHMPFVGMRNLPNYDGVIEKPKDYNKMQKLARKLSKNIPFVRIDFYYINNRIFFGEFTFFPTSGMGQFHPEKWNNILGDLLELPRK